MLHTCCRFIPIARVRSLPPIHSLLAAENAIAVQSSRHRDGWGLAFYLGNRIPHTIKSALPANADNIFSKVSGVVASETVLAHIRQATTGDKNILNSHPFQHGNWVFAHNGTRRCVFFDHLS